MSLNRAGKGWKAAVVAMEQAALGKLIIGGKNSGADNLVSGIVRIPIGL